MSADVLQRDGWWARRSIRNKLAIPFVLVIGAISLFVYLYFPGTMERRELAALEARGRSVGAVAAFGVQSAVIFEDGPNMEKVLRGLLESGEIVYALIRRPDGEVLSQFVSDAMSNHEANATGPGLPMTRVTVPVMLESDTIAEVTLLLSRSDLRASLAEMRATVQVVAVLIFLVGVLALILVSRVVTRPLFGIFDAAEHISAGDLSRRAVVTSQDELGQLASSFNTMVDRLQASQDELESMNRDLEERVEERTRRWQEEQCHRVRAEEEKQELENFFGQILDAVPLEVTVHDPAHRFVYVNPAAEPAKAVRESMIGLTPADAGIADRVGVSAYERREQGIARVVRTGCLVSLEEHVADADGEERHFLRVYSPMLDVEGEVTQVVGYGVDITNRRQAEQALRESEERLRQSQKMEAVGRLAGGIAHDFNNLLTVISGHTELLMSDANLEGDAYPDLEHIAKAADRAATLTRQLLAFSRKQVLQPRLLDVNEVVSGVEQMLARLIGEHIDLVTMLRPGLGKVMADPGQLEQVLMNLAVNSRDAMPEGGRLSIAMSQWTSADVLERWGHSLLEGEYVLMEVHDTGVGIPEHVQSKVFEPFFTTKEVGKGTGLGLATVYGIVSQSGGDIFLESSVGVGCTFRVFLPIVEAADTAPTEATRRPAASHANGSETILLVEDEPMVRELTRTILLRAGYRVLSASGPHEAYGVARNHEGTIDLLFTDVVMPGMPGHELAVKVQELREDVKVLYMSGYTDDALLDHGALQDGVVLLQKPFTTTQVLRVVRSVLDGAREAADAPH